MPLFALASSPEATDVCTGAFGGSMYVTGVIDGLVWTLVGLTAPECAVVSTPFSHAISLCFDAAVGALLNSGVVFAVEVVLRELDEID